jgi:hypothetical protein
VRRAASRPSAPRGARLHPSASAGTLRAPVHRPPSLRLALLLIATLTAAAACSGPTVASPTDGKAASAASATPPPDHASAALASAEPQPSGSATAPAATSANAAGSSAPDAPSAAPVATSSAGKPPGAADPTSRADADAATGLSVKVANIGMHIGGGPNDAVTKEPIRRSVEPHFDELRRCFAKADDPHKGGTFGIDLRIERQGGKAAVSHPRTPIKGKAFEACVVYVFESIDFLKPKGGKTVVSYSLRFTP